jgi:enhancing lycopene biosynthesis protein 2
MKIGVLLSGCGVYDGAEIQESVLTLLAIAEQGHEAICISIDDKQHHVVNHLNGEEMPESRNMMVEAARIARGAITRFQTSHLLILTHLLFPEDSVALRISRHGHSAGQKERFDQMLNF